MLGIEDGTTTLDVSGERDGTQKLDTGVRSCFIQVNLGVEPVSCPSAEFVSAVAICAAVRAAATEMWLFGHVGQEGLVELTLRSPEPEEPKTTATSITHHTKASSCVSTL